MKTLITTGMTLLAFCVLVPATTAARDLLLSGRTMGTSYHITIVRSEAAVDQQALHADIDRCLKTVNVSMSTYDPDSEISHFNRLKVVGQRFAVSTDFYTVMTLSVWLHRITDGAWDGTVGPLVNLWGFGSSKKTPAVADDDAISDLLANTGFQWIRLDPPASLIKEKAAIEVDLGSVAKGFGVDKVSALLRGRGFHDFLVEIGGEVYAAGVRSDGAPWRVGINLPNRGAAPDAVYKVVALSDQAMATSGDYRRFFKEGGKVYSHIIDPRTGRPVDNGTVSVSVIAANCMLADGLATAGMVMGPQAIASLADSLPEVDCLSITSNEDGILHSFSSGGFSRFLQ